MKLIMALSQDCTLSQALRDGLYKLEHECDQNDESAKAILDYIIQLRKTIEEIKTPAYLYSKVVTY